MPKQEEKEHHIWCNHYYKPREGCKMCEKFYKKYPMDGLTQGELLKKHFPNAILREGT